MSNPLKLYLVNYDVVRGGKSTVGSSLTFADSVGTVREEWETKLRKRYPDSTQVDVKIGAGYTAEEMQRRFVAAEIQRNGVKPA